MRKTDHPAKLTKHQIGYIKATRPGCEVMYMGKNMVYISYLARLKNKHKLRRIGWYATVVNTPTA